MKVHLVSQQKELRIFLDFPEVVYAKNQHFRLADSELLETLATHKSLFNSHAAIQNCLLYEQSEVIGRFMLICDQRMPELIQVAFLEFLPETDLKLVDRIREFARQHFPRPSRICFGLNGHLNHGLGILRNRFDEPPGFGLPYSADYYPNYFKDLEENRFVTFRLDLKDLPSAWENLRKYPFDSNIKIRRYSGADFTEALRIYTYLNNLCFAKHPYWSSRDYGEDYELFQPLRNLFCHEVLIIAECQGEPIGYLLWFPDFNQLLTSNFEKLQCKYPFSHHVRKLKSANQIDIARLAEIGIVERFQKKSVDLWLIKAFAETIKDLNFKFCEPGFVCKKNKPSLNAARKYMRRLFNVSPQIYREFSIYEADI